VKPGAGWAGWTVLAGAILLAVVALYFPYETGIRRWAEAFFGSGPPWWVAAPVLAGLLAADVVLPVPSSLVSTACGVLLGLWGGALVSWLGMTAGSVAGYWLGSKVGRRAAERLVRRQDLERVGRAAARFGDWVIILFRAVPVLAEASVVFAGALRMPRARFLVLSGLSNLGISLAYAAVGAFSVKVESFLLAFGGAILVPLAAMLVAMLAARLGERA